MGLFRHKGEECYNGGRKHKFEPRYNEKERMNVSSVKYYDIKELRNFLTLKVYAKDICVWCGKEIRNNGN